MSNGPNGARAPRREPPPRARRLGSPPALGLEGPRGQGESPGASAAEEDRAAAPPDASRLGRAPSVRAEAEVGTPSCLASPTPGCLRQYRALARESVLVWLGWATPGDQRRARPASVWSRTRAWPVVETKSLSYRRKDAHTHSHEVTTGGALKGIVPDG